MSWYHCCSQARCPEDAGDGDPALSSQQPTQVPQLVIHSACAKGLLCAGSGLTQGTSKSFPTWEGSPPVKETKTGLASHKSWKM